MINEKEFRPGNYVLQKQLTRILPVRVDASHYDAWAKAGTKDFFPVVIKADMLEKCGFVENKEYALLPAAREFKLLLPIAGKQESIIACYIKNNQESFGRAMTNGQPVSNNFYHLHQLQNLVFCLTNEELIVQF